MVFKIFMGCLNLVGAVLVLMMANWSYGVWHFMDFSVWLGLLFALCFLCDAGWWFVKAARLANFKRRWS